MLGIDIGSAPMPAKSEYVTPVAIPTTTEKIVVQNSAITWIKDLLREIPIIKSISIVEVGDNQTQKIAPVESKKIQKRSYNVGLKRSKRAIGLF